MAFFLYSHQLVKLGTIPANNSGPLVAVVALGLCVGFLPHNFHPAKIFMGDAGAMLLGLLMAASTISVVGQTGDGFSGKTYFFFAPIVIPFFILGIPMLDTAFAIVRRAGRRGNLAAADKNHLHHRLMRLGHGQRRSVLILWIWTALLSALVLYTPLTSRPISWGPLGVLVLGALLYTLFAPRGRKAADPTELVPSSRINRPLTPPPSPCGDLRSAASFFRFSAVPTRESTGCSAWAMARVQAGVRG